MPVKLDLDGFLERARRVHGDKYDYSRVAYKNGTTKVEIICHEHGSFFMRPQNHLNLQGCKKCGTSFRGKQQIELAASLFAEKASRIHNGKYDYSNVVYLNSYTKVKIVCPEHGVFYQKPNSHLMGSGCPICAVKMRADKYRLIKRCNNKCSSTIEVFVRKAVVVHGDKYDYSRVVYKNCDTKVIIGCPIHGWFEQTPYCHSSGSGCPKCGYERVSVKRAKTTDNFIFQAMKIYGEKYDYSKVNYANSKKPVEIICKLHGSFWQIPNSHLRGQGCQKCGRLRMANHHRKSLEQFVIDAKLVHGELYNYDKVNYKRSADKVEIICPKHGSFWQVPGNHLSGSRCPICAKKVSHKELLLLETVKRLYPKYDVVHGIWHPDLRFKKSNYRMQLDIYIPELNLAIEYQGEYHYGLILGLDYDISGAISRDEEKRQCCKENGIKLIEIDYTWNESDQQVKEFIEGTRIAIKMQA